MKETYVKLIIAIPLKEAVRCYKVENLHPMDRRLWDEVPEIYLKNALVTMVGAQ